MDDRQKEGNAMAKNKELPAAVGSADKATVEVELNQTTARIALLERRGIALYEDFADGRIDKNTYMEAKAVCSTELAGLEERGANLKARIADASAVPQPSHDESLLQLVLEATDVTDEVLSLVDCVTVYDAERIKVRFAFGDINAAAS